MSGRPFEDAERKFQEGRYPEAQEGFEAVVRADPLDTKAWSMLGIAAVHAGTLDRAIEALERATELGSDDAEAWFHLGVARSMRSEWGNASRAYQKAVALAPDDLVAWHRLGVALSETGDTRSAESAFERALVLSKVPPEAPAEPPASDPPDPHAAEPGERAGTIEAKSWLDLALSLLSLGDQEAARAAYEKAAALDPDRATHSLFPPMLHLLTTATEATADEESEGPELDDGPSAAPVRPTPTSHVGPFRSELSAR